MGETACINKIVSGGQTGADRAALDFAMMHALAHGGWCPKGRKAEDGPIDTCYALTETPSADYLQRTEWNVRDTDGSAIFTVASKLAGGSKRTAEFALRHRKPFIHLSRVNDGRGAVGRLTAFIRDYGIRVLNIAGSRASKEPEVARFVTGSLSAPFCNQEPCSYCRALSWGSLSPSRGRSTSAPAPSSTDVLERRLDHAAAKLRAAGQWSDKGDTPSKPMTANK